MPNTLDTQQGGVGLEQDLGAPDMVVGPFELWVRGRQFPDADDEWDGNWLNVVAHCSQDDLTTAVSGPVLDTVGFLTFRCGLERYRREGHTYAALNSVEPDISVEIDPAPVDPMRMRVEVLMAPDLDHEYRYDFEVDVAALPSLIAQCDAILRQYPVLSPARRGV